MSNVVGTVDVRTKYFNLQLTVPHSTPLQHTPFNLGNRKLEELDILWPRGLAGLVGVTFGYNGVTILPWDQTQVWLIGDNERRKFDMGIELNGPLDVLSTSADAALDHTLYITAKVTELVSPTNGPQTPIVDLS